MLDDETEILETADLGLQEDEMPPFVGQVEATNAIRLVARMAFSKNSPTLLALEGERGAGKTRLLHRTREIVERAYPNVRVLFGSRRRRNPGSYAPLSKMLLDRLELSINAPANQARARLMRATSETLHSADAVRVSETAHFVGHIVGVPFPDSPFTASLSKQPAVLHDRACEAACRLIEADAAQGPLLLLLDNLGGAEEEALDLLRLVLQVNGPIAVVAAGKAPLLDRLSNCQARGHTIRHTIPPLSEVDTAAFLHSMVPQLEDPPPALVAALTDRSAGNPSALKALIEDLRECEVLRPVSGGVRVDLSRLGHASAGLSLEDVLRARLARLSTEERTLLERAAVVGELFWEGALLAQRRSERGADNAPPAAGWANADDEESLKLLLRQLVEKAFIERIERSDVPGLDEYTFQHAALRTLVYGGVPEPLQRRRHLITARWLAAMSHTLPVDSVATIAVHLAHGGKRTEAAHAYLEAASAERRRMRTTMALRHVERALALLREDDWLAHIDARHQRGSLLSVLGRYDEAYAVFDEMLRRAWLLGARGKAGAALNRMARIHRQRGEHAPALTQLQRALSLFRAAHDQRGVASTLDDIAQVHRLQGDLEHAVRAAKEALDIRIAEHDERGQAVSLNTIGYIELDRGRFEVAASRFAAALELRQFIGDHEGTVQTRIALGKLAFQQGHLERALEVYRRALEGAREMGNRRFEAYLLHHLGEALMAARQLDEAHARLEEAKRIASELRDPRAVGLIERTRGLLALERGEPSARDLLERALEMARAYGHAEAIGLAQRALARFHRQTIFATDSRPPERSGHADRYLRQAIESFRQAGSEHELARSLAELGQSLLERGRIEEGKRTLEEAWSTLNRLALPEREQVQQTLAELS